MNDSKGFQETRIDPDKVSVKKIVLFTHSNDHEFQGIQFFDRDGNMILKAGDCSCQKQDFLLADNERLIGIKSRKHPVAKQSPR